MGPSKGQSWVVMAVAGSSEEADEHALVTKTIVYEYIFYIKGHEVRGMN